MSSSDEEASLDDERWDDMAIVRAFDDAMRGKKKEQKSSTRSKTKNSPVTKLKNSPALKPNWKQDSRKSTPQLYPQAGHAQHSGPAQSQRPSPPQTASHGSKHEYSGYMPAQATSHEELYQAAYAQAYTQLQSQLLTAQQPSYQPSVPQYPSMASPQLANQGGYMYPPQWMYTPPAPPTTSFASSPSTIPSMPFPSVPSRPPPAPAPNAGVQDDLANLLMSWYQAGYYAGRFQAAQEMRSNGPRAFN